jgi:hypothetical protein
MFQVQVSAGQEVKVLELAKFLGAQECPTAMFVEAAIMKFNAEHADQVAKLVRTH